MRAGTVGLVLAQLLLQVTEDFEHERLVAQVFHEGFGHVDRHVLHVVEAQRRAPDARVAHRFRREGLVHVIDEVVLTEDVAVLVGHVHSVQDRDPEREIFA